LNVYCQTAQEKERYDIIISEQSAYVTLEAVIGNNPKLDKQYLLANPRGVLIAINGDIYVPDEYSIKVFGLDGTGKAILGRRGQGPGEFDNNVIFFTISPTGFITATTLTWGEYSPVRPVYINIFSPDYKLVDKKRHRLDNSSVFTRNDYDSGKDTFFIRAIYALNESELMSFVDITKEDAGKCIYFAILENEKNKTVTAVFRDEWKLKYPEINPPSQGRYIFNMLTENSIVYINPADVQYLSDKKGEFTINIYSIKYKTTEKFSIGFSPCILPKENIDRYAESPSVKNKSAFKKALTELRYIYPCSSPLIESDDKYYYVEISDYSYSKYIVLYYIDKATRKLVKRIAFNVSGTMGLEFKNGRLYILKNDKDGYPAIFIYKINPAVWEKK
jgi:hypothetical protein